MPPRTTATARPLGGRWQITDTARLASGGANRSVTRSCGAPRTTTCSPPAALTASDLTRSAETPTHLVAASPKKAQPLRSTGAKFHSANSYRAGGRHACHGLVNQPQTCNGNGMVSVMRTIVCGSLAWHQAARQPKGSSTRVRVRPGQAQVQARHTRVDQSQASTLG